MPTLAERNYETPKSWGEFEEICKDSFQLRWSNPNLNMHGRQGQQQDGVDIYGYDFHDNFVGVQCKNTVSGISQSVITSECKKAESFNPPIHTLYIATTASRDVNIQKFVRTLSIGRKNNGQFQVEVVFWEDICSDLTRDESVLRKHYPISNAKPTDAELKRNKDLSHLESLLSYFDVTGTVDSLNNDATHIDWTIKEQFTHIDDLFYSGVFELTDTNIAREIAKFHNEWYQLILMMECAPYDINVGTGCYVFRSLSTLISGHEDKRMFDLITAQKSLLRKEIIKFFHNINSNYHEIDLNKTSLKARKLYRG